MRYGGGRPPTLYGPDALDCSLYDVYAGMQGSEGGTYHPVGLLVRFVVYLLFLLQCMVGGKSRAGGQNGLIQRLESRVQGLQHCLVGRSAEELGVEPGNSPVVLVLEYAKEQRMCEARVRHS